MNSIRNRLIVVTLCNLVIAMSLAMIFLSLIEHGDIWKWWIFARGFFPFIILFFIIFLLLNIITSSLVIRPVKQLTKDLQKFIKSGDTKEIDPARYPELEGLLEAAVEFVEYARKELNIALMMKGAADSRASTIRRDHLTGLFNREYLERYLPDELDRCRVLRQQLSVVMLDVDHFKHYNDANGHPEGDVVLKEIASMLADNTREHDICVRYGGEEFLIIMPRTPLYQAEKFCERVRAKVENREFPQQEKQPGGNLTISLGVASYPDHAADAEKLIKNADIALYEAKKQGRNRVVSYEKNLRTRRE